jgi:S-adenosylmethionine decarboxylase
MQVGSEWLIDASGCDAQVLRSLQLLRQLCERLLRELELRTVAEPLWHCFPEPGGITGIYLLAESHLTCHTYPEHGIATFNLHCCRARPRWGWEAVLAETLGAKQVQVRQLTRGATP